MSASRQPTTSPCGFDHAAKRSIPTVADAVRYFRPGARDSGYLAPDVDEHGVGRVDAINSAFMLVRRAALVEVGMLDEGYFIYGEDLDWCARCRSAGWEVVYDGRVTTLHVKGATAGEPALRPIRMLEDAKAEWLRGHPIPGLTSYAVVILRKPS